MPETILETPDSVARAAATAERHRRRKRASSARSSRSTWGPSHPSTHGVLRILLELDGEIVTHAMPDVGYLHRGDEKIAENMTYNQFVPYTDRLDYLAPLANNVAYALAVEKLMGWTVPPRGQVIRVICCELARISAHLLGMGALAMDTGAMTFFLYTFTEREKIYNLIELLTGARFTTSYTRIGGQTRDLPPGFDRAGKGLRRAVQGQDRRTRQAPDPQQDLRRSQPGHRHHLEGGRHRFRPHRPQPARLRRLLRRPQGPALPDLSRVRFSNPGRLRRRLLRPLSLPARGIAPERAHHRTGAQRTFPAGRSTSATARASSRTRKKS